MTESERYAQIIQEFIRQEVKAAGVKGAVLGVSGGIDSALVCALATKALGAENVLGLFLPSGSTPQSDYKDVEQLQSQFKFTLITHPISTLIDAFVQELHANAAVDSKNLAVANLAPRARMMIIYYYANKQQYLVLGTSNKAELLIGYSTKHGDSASDIAPIGDLYKRQVREMAKMLSLPKTIIEKAPSACLWVGQTTEGELGISYDHLERILAGLEFFKTPEEIAAAEKLPIDLVHRVNRMILKADHKRRLSKVLKLGYRTPTIDWQTPRV